VSRPENIPNMGLKSGPEGIRGAGRNGNFKRTRFMDKGFLEFVPI
jgi:hypothetical protein